MMLARRQPAANGLEKRVFDCPKCNEVLQLLVAPDDPIDKVGGYLSGDLRPPV
jgi:hypothetical protein